MEQFGAIADYGTWTWYQALMALAALAIVVGFLVWVLKNHHIKIKGVEFKAKEAAIRYDSQADDFALQYEIYQICKDLDDEHHSKLDKLVDKYANREDNPVKKELVERALSRILQQNNINTNLIASNINGYIKDKICLTASRYPNIDCDWVIIIPQFINDILAERISLIRTKITLYEDKRPLFKTADVVEIAINKPLARQKARLQSLTGD